MARNVTFDPLSNILIPNFKFGYDAVTQDTEFFLSSQNRMHDKD